MAEASSADVFLAALDLIGVALREGSRDEAAVAARQAAQSLDLDTARRVAGAAACVAAVEMRRRANGSAKVARMRLERIRLEAMWGAS